MRPVPKADELASTVRTLLKQIGEDTEREGLRKTPERVAESLRFLTAGHRVDPRKLLEGALFEGDYDEMVIVRDIEVYSLCEHHLLPFFGKCHVAYLPKGRIVGLSKLARVVDAFSQRLQVQERLTNQIASTIQEVVKPRGVGVVIEAQHLCMSMRGTQKQNSRAVTSAMLGTFRKHQATRDEFMSLIRSAP